MTFEAVMDLILGEAGVIVVLTIAVFFFVKGQVFPKGYVEDLKERNEILTKAVAEQSKSMDILSKTSVESLENSKTTLRILNEARKSTGVMGEEDDGHD